MTLTMNQLGGDIRPLPENITQKGAKMAWREITTEAGVWKVEAAAERRPYAASWQLMLSFRPDVGEGTDRFWASYPLEASSRNSLFVQADRIHDDELRAVLAEHVTS